MFWATKATIKGAQTAMKALPKTNVFKAERLVAVWNFR